MARGNLAIWQIEIMFLSTGKGKLHPGFKSRSSVTGENAETDEDLEQSTFDQPDSLR